MLLRDGPDRGPTSGGDFHADYAPIAAIRLPVSGHIAAVFRRSARCYIAAQCTATHLRRTGCVRRPPRLPPADHELGARQIRLATHDRCRRRDALPDRLPSRTQRRAIRGRRGDGRARAGGRRRRQRQDPHARLSRRPPGRVGRRPGADPAADLHPQGGRGDAAPRQPAARGRCEHVAGGTFHSFANTILRRHGTALGLAAELHHPRPRRQRGRHQPAPRPRSGSTRRSAASRARTRSPRSSAWRSTSPAPSPSWSRTSTRTWSITSRT